MVEDNLLVNFYVPSESPPPTIPINSLAAGKKFHKRNYVASELCEIPVKPKISDSKPSFPSKTSDSLQIQGDTRMIPSIDINETPKRRKIDKSQPTTLLDSNSSENLSSLLRPEYLNIEKPKKKPYLSSNKNILPQTKSNSNQAPKRIRVKTVKSISPSKLDKCSFLHEKMRSALQSFFDDSPNASLTAMQCQAFDAISSKSDVLVRSPSGSGKTLSYLVPLVNRLISSPSLIKRTDGTYILILVPTKELGLQTEKVLKKLLQPFPYLVAGHLLGCDKRTSEKSRIRKGMNIIVATPGRLHDHLQNSTCLNLTRLICFVIDEADLLLDLGYEYKFKEIINFMHSVLQCQTSLTKPYQTVLLSATLSDRVKNLSCICLEKPLVVQCNEGNALNQYSLDDSQEKWKVPQLLRQTALVLPLKRKPIALIWFLSHATHFPSTENEDRKSKIIVFFSTIAQVEFYFSLLCSLAEDHEDHWPTLKRFNRFKLHGDMEIRERVKIFKEFSSDSDDGSSKELDQVLGSILLTTDVAARGLDIPSVDWIFQYDPPKEPREYVHRIGRTARMGKAGSSTILLLPHEEEYLKVLEKHGMKFVYMMSLRRLARSWKRQEHRLNSQNSTNVNENEEDENNEDSTGDIYDLAWMTHGKLKEVISSNEDIRRKALDAYKSSITAYTSYPREYRSIFDKKKLHLGHLAESLGLSSRHVTRSTLKYRSPIERRDVARTRKFGSRATKSVNKFSASEFGGSFVSGPILTKPKFKRSV